MNASQDAQTSEGTERMHAAKEAAEDALNDLKGRANEYLELGREKAFAMTDAVGEQIRRRPAEAVAIAAGIGFALGFLWTRRS